MEGGSVIDIVERLRAWTKEPYYLVREAADEIERLRHKLDFAESQVLEAKDELAWQDKQIKELQICDVRNGDSQ